MTYARELPAFAARVRKLTKLIVEGDLTANVNGTAQDIALGTLPAGAVLMRTAPAVKLNTQFTGGGATSVGMTIGTAAAATLLATNFDLFGGAASGLYVLATAGAQIEVPAGGQSIIARITPDAGHTLLALTAGSVEVSIYFCVPTLQ